MKYSAASLPPSWRRNAPSSQRTGKRCAQYIYFIYTCLYFYTQCTRAAFLTLSWRRNARIGSTQSTGKRCAPCKYLFFGLTPCPFLNSVL